MSLSFLSIALTSMSDLDIYIYCLMHIIFSKGSRKVSPYFVPRILVNMAAGHISMRFGLQVQYHTCINFVEEGLVCSKLQGLDTKLTFSLVSLCYKGS